jgi:hypothetical protein
MQYWSGTGLVLSSTVDSTSTTKIIYEIEIIHHSSRNTFDLGAAQSILIVRRTQRLERFHECGNHGVWLDWVVHRAHIRTSSPSVAAAQQPCLRLNCFSAQLCRLDASVDRVRDVKRRFGACRSLRLRDAVALPQHREAEAPALVPAIEASRKKTRERGILRRKRVV